jgi:hypothetical protein
MMMIGTRRGVTCAANAMAHKDAEMVISPTRVAVAESCCGATW